MLTFVAEQQSITLLQQVPTTAQVALTDSKPCFLCGVYCGHNPIRNHLSRGLKNAAKRRAKSKVMLDRERTTPVLYISSLL